MTVLQSFASLVPTPSFAYEGVARFYCATPGVAGSWVEAVTEENSKRSGSAARMAAATWSTAPACSRLKRIKAERVLQKDRPCQRDVEHVSALRRY
jgi:hypothetical protein